jgi:stress response protein SCP2
MPINMTKGSSPVQLRKDQGITARVSWPAETDYDLGAEILYRDGTTESIATFPTVTPGKQIISPKNLVSRNGTVRHGGDAARGEGTSTETITVNPDAEIDSIAFWAYSAQSNGTGSFRRYAVSMEVTDGTETVQIAATNASDNATVYTCVPGMVSFENGSPRVEYLEEYSRPGSENRPEFRQAGMLKKTMVFKVDGGHRNDWK